MTDAEKKAAEEKKASEETKKAEEEKVSLAEKERLAEVEKTGEQTIPKARLDEVIAERNKLRKQIEKTETEKADADKKALEDQGKWKDVAALKDKELADLKVKNENAEKRMAVLAKLSTSEIQARDSSMIMRLIDFKKLTIEEGIVNGIDEQIKELKEKASYMFGTGKIPDSDNTNIPQIGGGKIDWIKAQKEMASKDYRELFKKHYGVYPE